MRQTLFRLFLILGLFGGLQAQSGRTEYFARVGTGWAAGIGFHTVFEFSNDSPFDAAGRLQFFDVDPSALEASLSESWSGKRGTLQAEEAGMSFIVPPRTRLELTVRSRLEGQFNDSQRGRLGQRRIYLRQRHRSNRRDQRLGL